MANVKKIADGSTSVSQLSGIDLSQAVEGLNSSTAEDMKGLWKIIHGGAPALLVGGLFAGVFFDHFRERWVDFTGRGAYMTSSSVPLPEGVRSTDLNPLIIAPDGRPRSFSSERALTWRLSRFQAYRSGRVPTDLTPIELEAFSRATNTQIEQQAVRLPDGRILNEYVLCGEFVREGLSEGTVSLGSRHYIIVYLFDAANGRQVAAQIRGVTNDGDPFTVQLAGDGEAFEEIKRADTFNKSVDRLGRDIARRYFGTLPDQAARELARRALVEWGGSSEVEKIRCLEIEIANSVGHTLSDPAQASQTVRAELLRNMGLSLADEQHAFIGEDGKVILNPKIVSAAYIPTVGFVKTFLARTEAVAYISTVRGMVNSAKQRREAEEKNLVQRIVKEARRAFK